MSFHTGITTEGTAVTKNLGIRAEDADKASIILANLYSSPVTPIRETIVNALEVTFPGDEYVTVEFTREVFSEDNLFGGGIYNDDNAFYTITVTDRGVGMSPEFVREVFTNLLASTKQRDGNDIGGFGLGAKSVASISNQTTWRTVRDGKATTVTMRPNDFALGTDISEPMDTDEPNGTRVSILVDGSTYRTIIDRLGVEFAHFLDPDSPLRIVVEGTDRSDMIGAEIANAAHFSGVYLGAERYEGYSRRFDKSGYRLRYKGMPYPVPEQISVGEMFDAAFSAEWAKIFGRLRHSNVSLSSAVIELGKNEVVVNPNREQVLYNTTLAKAVSTRISRAVSEHLSDYRDKMIAATTPQEYFMLARKYLTDGSRWGGRAPQMDSVIYAAKGKNVLVWNNRDNSAPENKYTISMSHSMDATPERIAQFLSQDGRTTTIERLAGECDSLDDFLAMDTGDAEVIVSDAILSLLDQVTPAVISSLSDADKIAWAVGASGATLMVGDVSKVRRSLMARGGKVGKSKGTSGQTDPSNAAYAFVSGGKIVGYGDVRGVDKEVKNTDLDIEAVSDIPTVEQDATLRAHGVLAVHSTVGNDKLRNKFGSRVRGYNRYSYCAPSTAEVVRKIELEVLGMDNGTSVFAPGLLLADDADFPGTAFYRHMFADGRSYLDRVCALTGLSDAKRAEFERIIDALGHDSDGVGFYDNIRYDTEARRKTPDNVISHYRYGGSFSALDDEDTEQRERWSRLVSTFDLARSILRVTDGVECEDMWTGIDRLLTVSEKIADGALDAFAE